VELEGLHDGAGGVARLWPTTPLVELEGLHAFLEGLHAFGSPAEWSAFVEQVVGKKKRHEHRRSSTFHSPTINLSGDDRL